MTQSVVSWATLWNHLPAIAFLVAGVIFATTTDPVVPLSVVLFLIGGFAMFPHHATRDILRRLAALEAKHAAEPPRTP